ncbi:hypothetical protein GCM10007216_05050 [Thalassobacillus devorans]|uniref:Phage capsid protein n=1 Tax=Thalassobacillus devorans TaxID=279813 RepID=A0ABQ1NHN7_9BACI|nr:DUF6366 family protein [Thalassobacillus devorans]NIK27412.1 hypothetical protein [Thalassobacillus devorans]GGC77514.1 hypothetical protein GCM10007216_05050 [Thalassobacillus devorans]
MGEGEESPEIRRERMRQEELKQDPTRSISGGGLPDLVGSLGWKGTGFVILLMMLGFILYTIFS